MIHVNSVHSEKEHTPTKLKICIIVLRMLVHLKYVSIFHVCRFFHVTEGLVPDIMHDILEGVLPFGIKHLLIDDKCVTLSYINDSISSFPFTYLDAANKPNIIESKTLRSSDHSLKQTGMWDFNYFILHLIYCSKSDVLGCYLWWLVVKLTKSHQPIDLVLLTIVDYCFAPLIALIGLDIYDL